MSKINQKSTVKKNISLEEFAKKMKEHTLSADAMSSQIRFLAGRILTIVDASVHEEKQNKAMKDLIRNEVASTLNHITTLATEGCELVVSDNEAEKIVESSLEEAIN